ncbi:MAG: folate-binding protein [Gammaproteobacteria bacterium]|nr:folate-binding protein [Gammaproteobacteria bacterium]NIM73887.1 folate-binding protein [Gammaproteobacteria bacterium]NIN38075.1 folate-binding protein [Gammaproteobacteria bacterium]NIO25668.1 folate-binding protein [Gammaproteobacteria bacterium]NIO66302.1 folate-binding protein [Gammaproteobacteria bacterium]
MSDIRSADLNAANVVGDGSRIAHFGDAGAEATAALEGDAVFDLRHLALIAVDGEDALDFLQGQLTNDVGEVGADRAQRSAWCSPKGRVLTCFLVFRHADRLLLQLPGSLIEPTLARLRMYVLRTRVTLENASDAWMRMGVVGDRCEARLRHRIGRLPKTPDHIHSLEGLTVIRAPGRRPRYEILGDAPALNALWNDCRSEAAPAGADAWELLDIEAGIPSIGPETSDAFVPQMINLDRIGGVSFTKGCYVGQEIVARTQHLGRIKRRMYRARWNGSAAVAPGETLEAAGEAASPKAQIVNARAAPGGGFQVLAVLPIEIAEDLPDTGLVLRDGSRLTLETLPYSLHDESG